MLNESEFLTDFREYIERNLKIAARVGGHHDGTHPRLVTRNRREADSLGEHPLFEQAIGQLHRFRCVSGDHRSDWALAGPCIEPELPQSLLEELRVGPELVDELRFFEEHLERRETRRDDRWRMRGREKKRPPAMMKEIDQAAAAGHVTPERSDGLRQGAHLNVYASVQPEMIDRAPPILSEHAARMGVVDHHDAAVFLGEGAQLGQRAEVAVHAEHAVSDQQPARRRRQVPYNGARGVRVAMRKHLNRRAAETRTVDD